EIGNQRRRDVDAQTDVEPLYVPGFQLLDAALEHEVGHRAHEPLLLADRDEVVRNEKPTRRMVPAKERFHRRNVPRAVGETLYSRLVVHGQLAVRDRPPQVVSAERPTRVPDGP